MTVGASSPHVWVGILIGDLMHHKIPPMTAAFLAEGPGDSAASEHCVTQQRQRATAIGAQATVTDYARRDNSAAVKDYTARYRTEKNPCGNFPLPRRVLGHDVPLPRGYLPGVV